MYQCICQCLSYSHMCRCLCLPLIAFQSERFRQEILKCWQNTTIELEQIRCPISVRTNAVYPSVFRVLYLLIVRKEVRILIHYSTISTEH